MEILGDLHTRIYPCKMLTFWYTGYDGMTIHVQIHASITHQHVHVRCTHTFPYFPLILTHRKKLMYKNVQLCTYISFSRNQLGGRGGRPPSQKLGPPVKCGCLSL